MSRLKRRLRHPAVAAILLVCLLTATVAGIAAERHFTATLSAGHPMVRINLAGAVEKSTGPVSLDHVGSVAAGDVLKWQINSENQGDGAARDYRAVGRIPKGTIFVAGSATADGSATVTYSIDEGKTYSATPTIEQRQADESVKQVPAPVAMYTQVRYEWTDELAAGGRLSASYEVRVR